MLQRPRPNLIRTLETTGSGKGYICLSPDAPGRLSGLITPATQVLSERYKVVSLTLSIAHIEAFKEEVESLAEAINNQGVRHGPVIAFGEATLIAQYLAVLTPKLVRTLVLVDPVSKQTRSVFEGFLQQLERGLPLGLPLRKLSRSLDREPFLHRVRCPVLAVSSSSASKQSRRAAELLSRRMPCCWHTTLDELSEVHQLLNHLEKFQSVQARCPMKGGRPRSRVAAPARMNA